MPHTVLRPLQLVLVTALSLASIFSVEILSLDKWLWSVSPQHAFGLILFLIIDIVLVLAILRRIRLATTGALIISLVQLSAMIVDLFGGAPPSTPGATFTQYLLGNAAFDGLLIVQGIILVAATLRVTRQYPRKYTPPERQQGPAVRRS
jgi:hypothetical protein